MADPATLAIDSGSGQSATVGAAFAAPLVAKVTDASGNPVAGVSVTFTAPASGASGTFPGALLTDTVTTDGAGLATSSAFTANTEAGSYSVTASSSGLTSVDFALTNTAGAAATLAIDSGSGQSATVGAAFAAPLVAKVTDASGNPVAGVSVTFTAPASGASGTFPGALLTDTVTTDGAGLATSSAFTANTEAGSYSVTASSSGLTSVDFALTNTAGAAATLAIDSGSGQSATVGAAFAAPLVAKVTDASGNPVAGVSVTFTAPASGASGTFPGAVLTDTVTTDGAGLATSAAFTANTEAGSYSVTASSSGLTSVDFALTNTAGAAATLAIDSGSGQSATVGAAFAAPLVAKVTDASGNPVAGVSVTFTAPASGASGSFPGALLTDTVTTDGAGLATSSAFTANTEAGSYSVTASSSGLTSVDFALTNTAGAAATLAIDSGSGQSATVGAAFAAPLVAKVTDASGNPVAGVSVTFTAPASGASGSFPGAALTDTVTTDGAGLATSSAFTANTEAGSYSVTASSSGLTSVDFALTNTAGAAATLAIDSGSGQSATVGAAFAAPLVAKVTDASGNPVAGVSVTFTAPASGASGTFPGAVLTDTVTTDGAGLATSSAFTANTEAGSYSVTASSSGLTSVDFALTNTAGAAATLAIDSGSGQSATVGAAFAAPLVAKVTDASGNPVAGVSVTFTAPASGASGTFPGALLTDTVTTDGAGLATSSAFTANTEAGSYSVTASSSGLTSVDFALTNTAGAAVATTTTLSGTPNPSGSGQSVTFTATVSPVVPDGGLVTFKDGSAVLGTGTTTGGVASFSTAALGIGAHSITATYDGATGFAGSTSAPLAHNVIANGTVVLAVSAPDDSAAFAFSSGTPSLNASVTLSGGTGQTSSISLFPGTYTASLSVPTGYGVTRISCSDSDSSGDPASGRVTIVLAAAETVTCTFEAVDSRTKTVEVIQRFLQRRNDLLLSNGPDRNREIDRLLQHGSQDASGASMAQMVEGLPQAGTGTSLAGAPHRRTSFGTALAGRVAPDGSAARQLDGTPGSIDTTSDAGGLFGRFDDTGPFGYSALGSAFEKRRFGSTRTLPFAFGFSGENFSSASFSTSLAQVAAAAADEKRRHLAGGAQNLLELGISPTSLIMPQIFDFDVWLEGRVVRFDDGSGDNGEGHFSVVYLGVDYVLSPNVLVGALVQYDHMEEDYNELTAKVEGSGWMAGPYATVRITDSLFLQTRAAWGRSSNEISPFLTYTDQFKTERWLVEGSLQGRWQYGNWSFRPEASVSYLEEVQEGYVDSLNVYIPEQTLALGQAHAGPQIAYQFISPGGGLIEPYINLEGIWNFERSGTGVVVESVASEADIRGKVELGFRALSAEGITLDASGSYDGVGTSYQAISGSARLGIPLN